MVGKFFIFLHIPNAENGVKAIGECCASGHEQRKGFHYMERRLLDALFLTK